MTLETMKNGSALTIALSGRLDTSTAPELEKALGEKLDGIDDLTLDFGGLEYLSSAGLRVILSAQKRMQRQGHMSIAGVCPRVMEVFEITGFADMLDIR
jgi:anti-sigma B factor antagonist